MASSKAPETVLPPKLGYDDFWELPDDGNRYEIIDGKLYVTPTPAMRHQLVSTRLLRVLDRHVVSAGMGHVFHAPTAVILGPHRQVQPDLLFISRERKKNRHIQGGSRRPRPGHRDRLALFEEDGPCRQIRRLRGFRDLVVLDRRSRRTNRRGIRLETGQYHLVRKWEEPQVFEPKLFPGPKLPLEDLFDWSDFEGLGPA